MRRLILLRHAKTEREAPSKRDIDRRLDERGKQDAASIGQWLVRQGYRPDMVLVSDAVRAQESWAILAKSLPDAKAETRSELYSADAGELLSIIHAVEVVDPKLLMIVAHNPTLHELALTLIATGETEGLRALAANLPTTGVVVIDLVAENWGDVGFRSGKLQRFASPKLLKEWSDKA